MHNAAVDARLMKPKVARALLVVTAFALLVVVSLTASFLLVPGSGGTGTSLPRGFLTAFFFTRFRYYLLWALAAPGVFWLARRVPLASPQSGRAGARRHFAVAIATHILVPAVGAVPFLLLRIVLGEAWPVSLVEWRMCIVSQVATALPIYWLLVALATAHAQLREHAANELRAAALQRSLAEAELEALRMKVQPHFLFNTLNAMASLAGSGETASVTRIVEHLGNLLRLSMDTGGRQMVTLEEELALVDEYLEIDQIRFGERLRIGRRIAGDVRHAIVPNLVLQPLVENALTHGVARRLGAGLLEIHASRDDGTLRVSVRDDGPGLPPGWRLSTQAGGSLRTVVERLQMLYGDRARLEMDNDRSGGAIAMLTLPLTVTESGPWTPSGRSSSTTSSLPAGV